MSDAAPDPRTFYTETLPGEFARALREQERAVEAAQRLLDGMRGVDATLTMRVDDETFHLNLEGGRMATADAPKHPPVLTLVQDRRGFERLMRDVGGSPLAFLGALSGLGGQMHLTRGRLEGLAGVRGCLHFEVAGDEGFVLLAHFGPDPLPEKPDTRIRIQPEVYDQLRRGQLDAQSAFMGGSIEVDGDMQLAMQVALAAMAPD